MMKEFHMSREVGTLTIALFVAGYCVGPLLWGPLSEQVRIHAPECRGGNLFHHSVWPTTSLHNRILRVYGMQSTAPFSRPSFLYILSLAIPSWMRIMQEHRIYSCPPILGRYLRCRTVNKFWVRYPSLSC